MEDIKKMWNSLIILCIISLVVYMKERMNKVKKGDFIWLATIVVAIGLLFAETSQHLLKEFLLDMPGFKEGFYSYIMGFLKFSILATLGELMALRIITGGYKKPAGLVWRVLIWGFIGMLITLMFNVFAGGVIAAQEGGFLPFEGTTIAFAFFTSTIMNLFFAPAFMGFHKYTDTYLDLKAETNQKVTVKDITNRIDWDGFVSFVLMKTIPFFWIPAHTITFMLPKDYRVLAAAFLSVALGALLAMSKKKK